MLSFQRLPPWNCTARRKFAPPKRGWLHDSVWHNFCFSCGSTIDVCNKNKNPHKLGKCVMRKHQTSNKQNQFVHAVSQIFVSFSATSPNIQNQTMFRILVVAEYTDRTCVFLQRVAQNRHYKGIVVVPKKRPKHKIYCCYIINCCSTHPPTKQHTISHKH